MLSVKGAVVSGLRAPQVPTTEIGLKWHRSPANRFWVLRKRRRGRGVCRDGAGEGELGDVLTQVGSYMLLFLRRCSNIKTMEISATMARPPKMILSSTV